MYERKRKKEKTIDDRKKRSRQEIEKEFRKKEPNKYMPAYCIPTKEVIKYFDLDIEFLKSLVFLDNDDHAK